MKVLGIGNAIIDVICKVDDEYLKKNNLTKSTMKLVNEKEFKSLVSNLKIQETVSGGSVANSIVGLSQLNNQVGFIGKISDDELGQKYEDGLKKERVKFFYSLVFFSTLLKIISTKIRHTTPNVIKTSATLNINQ